MPKDRITMSHQSYGFVEFMSEEDADYAIKIMNMIKLYGKPVRVNKVRALHCVQLRKRKWVDVMCGFSPPGLSLAR